MVGSNSFKKRERLSKKKLMDELFAKGKKFNVYPFKVIYLPVNNNPDSPAQFGISVPKRKIKTAVERNLIKRRVREAYRLNKKGLYQTLIAEKKSLIFMLLYLHEEKKDYADLENKIKLILERLISVLSEENIQ